MTRIKNSNENNNQTIVRPIKKNGYIHRKADARKSLKRDQAINRQAKYDALTLDEKIVNAVRNGGSQRELARLNKLKESSPTPLATVMSSSTPVVVEPTEKKINKKGKKAKA